MFYTTITNIGLQKITQATNNNTKINLTKISVGDGELTPSVDTTELVNKVAEFNINRVDIDSEHPNRIKVEALVPNNLGELNIKEIGVLDSDGDLFAVGNIPETYVPNIEDAVKEVMFEIYIDVTNVSTIDVSIDDSLVYMTIKDFKSKVGLIKKPSILQPTNNATDFNGVIKGSQFTTDVNFDGNLDYIEYQLAKDSNFTDIVDTYTGTSYDWTPNYGNNPTTQMYVRVRYGSDNHRSEWSDVISFTTSSTYIETPTITIQGEPDNVLLSPTITGSTFNIINSQEIHESTDWVIKQNGSIIWSSLGDTVNLTSITIPSGNLIASSTYTIEVTYHSASYSATASKNFTTTNATEKPVLSGSNTVNEYGTITLTIDNYNAGYTYNINVPTGTATRSDSTIIWQVGGVNSNTNYQISVTATDVAQGLPESEPTLYTVTVINIPMVEDQALIYNSGNISTEFEKTNGIDTSDNTLKPIKYENVLDTNHTSTVSEVFINNAKIDVKVGDTFKTDNDEMFTVSIVNSDGSTAFINNVKQIASSWTSTYIIDQNDYLWSCGRNQYGQLGLGDTIDRDVFVNTGIQVKKIAPGTYYHILAIDLEDNLLVCGRNGNGQLGLGNTQDQHSFVNTGIKVKDVSAGGVHSGIIKLDDTVWVCGDDYLGQLGTGDTDEREYSFIDTGFTGKSIKCANYSTYIIDMDDTLWATGDNYYGQFGLGNNDDYSTFQNTEITCKGVYPALNGEYTHIIKQDDTLWAAGQNYSGALGLGNTTDYNTFQDTGLQAKFVSGQGYHTSIIDMNDNVLSCGYNSYGQLGLGDTSNRNTFVNTNITAKSVSVGNSSLVIQKLDNSIIFLGKDYFGESGTGKEDSTYITPVSPLEYNPQYSVVPNPTLSQVPTEVYLQTHRAISKTVVQNDEDTDFAGLTNIIAKEVTENVLDTNNTSTTSKIYIDNSKIDVKVGDTFKTDNDEMFAVTNINNDGNVLPNRTIKQISVGGTAVAIILDDDSLWISGYYAGVPSVFTNTGLFAKQVACGYAHIAMIDMNNKLWTYGVNSSGQLGLGDNDNRSSFTDTGKTAKYVACGDNHTIFIDDIDNSVFSTGNNFHGQLGIGNTTTYNQFVDTGKSGDKVVCGNLHSILLSGDTVYATGFNGNGQLGTGNTDNLNTFQLPNNNYNIVDIACGDNHTIVLKDDGTVWGTGSGGSGELNGLTNKLVLTDIGVTAKAIVCGKSHTAIIDSNNELKLCGYNNNGQLGDGTTTERHSFITVGKNNCSLVSAGYNSTVIVNDSLLWVAGENNYSKLGLDTNLDMHSFTKSDFIFKYFTNYWTDLDTSLTTAPNNLYPISTFEINNNILTINNTTLDTNSNILTYTLNNIGFEPTRKLKLTTNSSDVSTITEFSATINKQGS